MANIKRVVIDNQTGVDIWVYWVGVLGFKLMIWLSDKDDPPGKSNHDGREILASASPLPIILREWNEFNGLIVSTEKLKTMLVRLEEKRIGSDYTLRVTRLLN